MSGTAPPGEARETWALIECGAGATVAPTTQVAGLSLVARHARVAARAGLDGLVVVAPDDGIREEIAGALAAQPAPAGFPVAVVAAPPGEDASRRWVILEPGAVYLPAALTPGTAADQIDERGPGPAGTGAPPLPLVRLERPDDIENATARLIEATRKNVHQDGAIAYHLVRRLSRPIARALLPTRVTPNQVTLVCLALGMLAGGLASQGGAVAGAAAGLCIWLGLVVDCVDGDLARWKVESSRLGQWLDTLADDLTNFSLIAGLGTGLWRDTGRFAWLALGIGSAAVFALAQGKMYADLHRLGGPIDTAYYPWFFGRAAHAPGTGTGPVARIVRALSALFRRDAVVTGLALLLVAGQRTAAALVLASGIWLVAAMLAAHLSVVARRRSSR